MASTTHALTVTDSTGRDAVTPPVRDTRDAPSSLPNGSTADNRLTDVPERE